MINFPGPTEEVVPPVALAPVLKTPPLVPTSRLTNVMVGLPVWLPSKLNLPPTITFFPAFIFISMIALGAVMDKSPFISTFPSGDTQNQP